MEIDPTNIYVNASISFKMAIPAYICSLCDVVVYEPKDYAVILQAEEIAQGRSYVKIEVKHGKVNKYSVH